MHGGCAYCLRNTEGERILELAIFLDLVVTNSQFKKRPSHLITFESGGNRSQIDYIILCRKQNFKLIKDVKVIPGEECVTQHKLLVCDLRLKTCKPRPKPFIPKRRIWKLKEPTILRKYQDTLTRTLNPNIDSDDVGVLWEHLKTSLLSATEEACGWTSKHKRRETWWWDGLVHDFVKEKRRRWKIWKEGGDKEPYLVAKREAKKAVYDAKFRAENIKFTHVHRNDVAIFKMAKQMRKENLDVCGEKCIKDDSGNICMDTESKKNAWKQHFDRLLNTEFQWDAEDLSSEPPVAGPPPLSDVEAVAKAILKIKSGKAAGPSEIVGEMVLASNGSCTQLITALINAIIRSGRVPVDWDNSFIISIFKGKGDALDRGSYRGLKLLDHIMKILERIVEQNIRELITLNDMQFGFMPGRGTTDAIFIVRQMQEKYNAKGKTLYFSFVDLEKAFDRVPRKVLWWALKKLNVPEWLVNIIQAMYYNPSSKVCVESSYSDSFGVNVGVHQGSVLSPLLFIIVLEALSQEFRTGRPWEILYADDLVIIAESLDELLHKLATWKQKLETKGLRINMGKTKIMISGPDLNNLVDSGKFPCSICRSGVGSNSIFCAG